ncbi:MAG: hypothetical protein WAQ07_02900 [Candidatus Omnitrophota bacterium]
MRKKSQVFYFFTIFLPTLLSIVILSGLVMAGDYEKIICPGDTIYHDPKSSYIRGMMITDHGPEPMGFMELTITYMGIKGNKLIVKSLFHDRENLFEFPFSRNNEVYLNPGMSHPTETFLIRPADKKNCITIKKVPYREGPLTRNDVTEAQSNYVFGINFVEK